MLDAASELQDQIKKTDLKVRRVILSGRPTRLKRKVSNQLAEAGYKDLFSEEDLILKPHGYYSAGWKKDKSDIFAEKGPFFMFEDDVLSAIVMALSHPEYRKRIYLKDGNTTDRNLLRRNGYDKLPQGIEVFHVPGLAHYAIARSLGILQ